MPSGGPTSRWGTPTCISRSRRTRTTRGRSTTRAPTRGVSWREERETGVAGKGFIECDLDDRGAQVSPCSPLPRALRRPAAAITARGLTAADVDARIRDAVERLPRRHRRASRAPRRPRPSAPHRPRAGPPALREYKRRALHFQLDARRPELIRLHGHRRAPGRRPSLADIVRDKLQSRLLEGDIDRDGARGLSGSSIWRDAEAVSAGRR